MLDAILGEPPKVKTPLVESLTDSTNVLPLWVKLWLLLLAGVHLALFGFLTRPPGIAALVTNAVNMPIFVYLLWRTRGITKILGIAHVIAWTPLAIYLIYYLATEDPQDDLNAYIYAICNLVVTLISLVLDYIDSYVWIVLGKRDVPHSDAFKAKYGIAASSKDAPGPGSSSKDDVSQV